MRIYNKLIIAFLGGLTLSGCSKQLDRQPFDSFSDANAYANMTHIQMGTNEAYGRYGAYANDMYINALLSDEAKLGKDNAGQGALTYRYQFGADPTTGGDVTAAWRSYYRMLDQVNSVLSFIPKITLAPGEEARRDIVRGQLLGLRAIAHFSLLEMYADRYDPAKPGVPIMLVSDVLSRPARNTMGEVMAQIEKDLSEAKALLPAATAANFTDTVMNSLNITGYQARIALYKRDYPAAIAAATTVINANIRPLATGANFTGIWTEANINQEVLFRIRYATSAAIGSMWTTTGNLFYISPSDKLVAALPTSDVRRGVTIGGSATGGFFVNKFYTSPRGGRVVDIKAMRIAEMYLIRAEANARNSTPNLTAATDDLNTLRAARITGYTPQTFSDATALINAIMEERFKELAFEGFRWFDLKRNNLPVNRLATDANPEWQNLPANSPLWTLPIPRYELDSNPNMVQNPGYQ
jgi:starch-binding outer membrane protein, SusD/RagB family